MIPQYRLLADAAIHPMGDACSLVTALGHRGVRINAGFLPLVEQLRAGWCDEAQLLDVEDAARHYYFLHQLRQAGLLDMRLSYDGGILCTLSPAPPEETVRTRPDPALSYRLNRFTLMRCLDEAMVLESPLTPSRIIATSPTLWRLLHCLAAPCPADDLPSHDAALLGLLWGMGMVEPAEPPQGEDPMAFWEFHDILFHARTLYGRSPAHQGGTYRHEGKRPSPPVAKPPVSEVCIDLPPPSVELAMKLARPFGDVLETRASRRDITDALPTLEELGALLHAAARIKRVEHVGGHDEDVSLRPSPSGGARHALEIYPLIRRCQGLEPGAWHYNPLRHRLERVSVHDAAQRADMERVMELNPYESLGTDIPQITLYFSARLGRTAWKYEALAYKLINQDLGCLYQTLYLVATALDLKPCALGSLDAPLLGRTLGVDWRAEPFVGAFVLGK